MNYIKKLDSFYVPLKSGEYHITIPKHSKLLHIDDNVVYYEYTYDKEKGDKPELADYYFKIVTYNKEVEIPTHYEYAFMFKHIENGTNIMYVVYVYDSSSAIMGKFMNMFGGF